MLANRKVNQKLVASKSNKSYHYLLALTGNGLPCDWRLAATNCPVGALFWDEGMSKRKTPEDYHKLAKSRGFEWLGPEVSNNQIKTKWQCPEGHQWLATYHGIQAGHACLYCCGQVPRVPEDYVNLAIDKGFEWIGPMPRSVDYPTEWQCSKGHKWITRYSDIKRGQGCPHCSRRFPKMPKDYHNLSTRRGFLWLGPEVQNIQTKTEWQCQKGHRWFTSYNVINRGDGCPVCSESGGERTVANFLKSFNIHYEREKRFNACRHRDCLPFDFYFVLSGKMFLIEYDGKGHYEEIPHWGSLEDRQVKDKIKDDFAERYGFNLIRVPYTEKEIGPYLQRKIEYCLGSSLFDLPSTSSTAKSKNFNPDYFYQLSFEV